VGGEAILFTPAVGLALGRVLALLLIPLLPVLAGLRAVRLVGPARTRWSPGMEIAALVVGCVAAPVLLSVALADGRFSLGLGDIFRTDGPWALDFRGFLVYRALPLLGAPLTLLRAVASGRAGADVTGITVVLGTAALILGLAPVLVLRSRAGLASSLRNAFLLLWGAYAGVYLLVLLAWVANHLNFWCFLVLFVAVSLRRD